VNAIPTGARVAEPYLQKITDRVHAYIQPDGGWCLNNAGIVIGDEQVLLIDTAATAKRTFALRDAIASLTDAPVRTVVNTHHHGDHTHGNYVFADTATIIGHELCAPGIQAEGKLLEQLWPAVEWGEIERVVPDQTFSEKVTLDVDGIVAEVIHIPASHTVGDSVVWLPEQRVLFTGDLIFSGGTPFILMGSLAGSLAAVSKLRDFDPSVIVAGHGQVTDVSAIDATENYLAWLAQYSADAHARGLSPLEAAQRADLGAFAQLHNAERLVANLHRAYAELDGAAPGAALDLGAAIVDIANYGGGMPECLA
jgi:cyclase